MDNNSTSLGDLFALNNNNMNMLRTLEVETLLSIYKTAFDLNAQDAQNQTINTGQLERLLKETGFAYDPQQNIFYSRMDAWQRSYGYCRLYDEATAPLSMVIDCEPIRFEYENKKWLIELWKGQYGMTTGGEIGVFTSGGSGLPVPDVINGVVFRSAADDYLLQMSFTLKKNGRVLFRRSAKHWWLTGFILGEFSEPSELSMDVTITLKNDEMRREFVDSLIRLGYSDQEIGVADRTVTFTFSVPRTEQPRTRTELVSKVSQAKNKFLCRRYQTLANATHGIYRKMKGLEHSSPDLYGRIVGALRQDNLFQAYETLVKFLGIIGT